MNAVEIRSLVCLIYICIVIWTYVTGNWGLGVLPCSTSSYIFFSMLRNRAESMSCLHPYTVQSNVRDYAV